MGYQKVREISNLNDQQEFLSHLLHDIEDLKIMSRKEMFEKDMIRIGQSRSFALWIRI